MNENNIFENAKFGDKFVTRDCKIAIYHFKGMYHNLILGDGNGITCKNNGNECGYIESTHDIVSRYQEPINEEKLDELATNYMMKERNVYEGVIASSKSAYKAGYRKAKKNKT